MQRSKCQQRMLEKNRNASEKVLKIAANSKYNLKSLIALAAAVDRQLHRQSVHQGRQAGSQEKENSHFTRPVNQLAKPKCNVQHNVDVMEKID